MRRADDLITHCGTGHERDFERRALTLSIQPLHSLDPVRHWTHVSTHGAPFLDAALLAALSHAASSAANAASGPEPAPLPGAGLRPPAPESWAQACAQLSTSGAHVLDLAAVLIERHIAALGPPDSTAASTVRVPPPVLRLAPALQDSQLAASLARACFASVGPRPVLPPLGPVDGSAASSSAPAAGPIWDPPLVRARTALAGLLGHADVAAMRLALLQGLWRQSGMGPEHGGGGDGWGPVAVMSPEDRACLWMHHEQVLKGSLGLWQAARAGRAELRNGGSLPPEPGVPAGEQLARMAARTAEALHRLRCDGGEASARPAPGASLSCTFLLPVTELGQVVGPSEAERGHWADAAAWLLPESSQALELWLAEPASRSDATWSRRLYSSVDNLARAVGTLASLGQGLGGAWPSHRARVGLGAALDHALRLACVATDCVGAAEEIRSLQAQQVVIRAFEIVMEVPKAVAQLELELVAMPEAVAGTEAGAEAGGRGRAALGEGGRALLSCAKRAAALAWGLEAAGPLAPEACLQPTSLEPGPALSAMFMFLWYREQQYGRPAEPPTAAAAAPAAAGGAGGGGALEDELDAYVMQAAGRLAAQAVASTSSLDPLPGTACSAMLQSTRHAAAHVVCFCLRHIIQLCGHPTALQPSPIATTSTTPTALCQPGCCSLPLARLLACQPHRLLVAGCKLLCAWAPGDQAPIHPDNASQHAQDEHSQWWVGLASRMPLALAALAAHPQLSSRVRRWLVHHSTGQGQGDGTDDIDDGTDVVGGGGGGGGAAAGAAGCSAAGQEGQEGWGPCEGEEGCLALAWHAAMRSRGAEATRYGWQISVCGSALQRAAQGASGGGGGGDDSGGGGGASSGDEGSSEPDADTAFRQVAMSLVEWMVGRMGRGEVQDLAAACPPPFRDELRSRFAQARSRTDVERLAAAEAQSAGLMVPLPLPLAAPPAGRVLSRLRVCGNPGCCEFGGRSEGGLPLLQCGGCRAVRYCGGACQWAHWRAGHKGEYGAMAAAMAAASESLYGPMYGSIYTPSLLSTSFQTSFSVTVSMLMYAAFLFTIGYTSYFWLSTPYDLSESTTYHQEGVALLPFPDPADPNQQHAPKIGFKVNYRLPGRSRASELHPALLDISAFQMLQCWSSAGAQTDTYYDRVLLSDECTFSIGGQDRVRDATCVDWEASVADLVRSGVSQDMCGNGKALPAPRVMGNYYSQEFAWLETHLGAKNLSRFNMSRVDGSIEMFLQFPYTGTNSLIAGTFPSSEEVIYSRKVPMAPPGQRVRWELVLRMRQVIARNVFWYIPRLNKKAMDYTVSASEVTYEVVDPSSSSSSNNLARIYIKMDDRDTRAVMTPHTSFYSLIGDWGGFLSILLLAGLPAHLLNKHLFRSACKRLLAENRIEFDDGVRREREKVLKHKSTHSIQRSKTLRKKDKGHHFRRHFHLHGHADEDPLAGIPAPDVPNPLFAGACPGDVHGSSDDAKQGAPTQDGQPGKPLGEAAEAVQGTAARAPLVPVPLDLNVVTTADVGSITVKYEHDVFEDSEEDEDDFDDVVRHCTSECTSMYHLRQVVKIVQEEVRMSDLWKSHHGSRQGLYQQEGRVPAPGCVATSAGHGATAVARKEAEEHGGRGAPAAEDGSREKDVAITVEVRPGGPT
ncbi:hypothetical protein HYH03_008956 [Edaphochlamys debaryana]|uniref:MYND-type domain-containing protein n=1 Tax=Edaphochlamys debaryana TaxID=47281 RepID=A0A835XYY1_9CHLO|nr:hypothetical protein HYH03_008956 [Edaphochlamys debaryana]|eukprot:KAG2492796.1 hypothetical protein HYH03_008956 [Edaphochlamys debaryana]